MADFLCFCRDLDKLETGRRELSGEWVVGTDVWKRLKAERRIRHRHVNSTTTTTNSKPDGKSASAPPTLSDSIPSIGRNSPDVDADSDSWVATRKSGEKERVIYYVHGGAYYVGNAATHRSVTIGMSKACNARVFGMSFSHTAICRKLTVNIAITYRLAPENVFPLPLHDVLHGYLRLLAPPLSISPENIIIAGDSAGGGLSLALCMYLRDEGYKMPAGIILMSPWVDLTMSCGSWDENMEWDVVPQPKADGEYRQSSVHSLLMCGWTDHLNPVGCYLGPTGIATYLTHPYASPLFGDLQDLPPMLIQSGDSEVLRDEITLLAHKATLAGVQVTHELYEDMVHVFQMFTFLPAAQAAIKSVGRWVRVTLPRMEEERSRDWNVPIDEGVEVSGDMGGVGGMDGVDGVDGEMDSGATKMVSEDGQVVGKKSGRSEVTPSEMTSTGDARRTQRQGHGSLRLNLQPSSDQPSIDLDSLPANSRSGSPTPTGSPIQPSSPDPFGSSRSHGPRLRRALTDFAATSTPASPIHSPPQHAMRQRRRTQGAASLHVSPAHSTSNPSDRDRSPVISPSPSIRRRLRSPTVSSTSHPTMRNRSQSHSDIFHLVEGYVEGGAANETVVYAPGGEIRSVGVLGEDLEDE